MAARDWGEGRGVMVQGREVSLWDDANLLELDSGEAAQPCEYAKPLTCTL